jgi:Trk K+ transport system NAD-binding subunit
MFSASPTPEVAEPPPDTTLEAGDLLITLGAPAMAPVRENSPC